MSVLWLRTKIVLFELLLKQSSIHHIQWSLADHFHTYILHFAIIGLVQPCVQKNKTKQSKKTFAEAQIYLHRKVV